LQQKRKIVSRAKVLENYEQELGQNGRFRHGAWSIGHRARKKGTTRQARKAGKARQAGKARKGERRDGD
jgi:hypothetical protein